MKGEAVKRKLRNGERIYGSHILTLGNPLTAGWTTKKLELDYAFICTEHIPIDRTEVAAMCKSFTDAGISPLVRIPVPTAQYANMAIEGGAEGIAAPYVETVEQVQELVGSVKYRPLKGKFLADVLNGTREPAPLLTDYMKTFNKDLYLILGIESVAAVENLEALISSDGVDGVYIGPHDLTCSMEIPEQYTHPDFVRTVLDVIKRCRKLNKGVGFFAGDVTGKECIPYFEAGMNIIFQGADETNMLQHLGGDIRKLRSDNGDKYFNPVLQRKSEDNIII